jgi:phosphatidyl-myo-inositol dimannoside synthase
MCAHRPRLLVMTPDFPPARGGIQVLAHRLAAGMRGFQTRVVALDSPGAGRFDASSGVATRRVRAGRRLGAGGRNAALDAAALGEALRFRPQLVLSAHIVCAPAAACVRGALGARTVQYFYAKEIPNRPRLAAFAARRADATIAVSSYTAGLLAAIGVPAGGVNLIPPGVDLPSDLAPGLPSGLVSDPPFGPAPDLSSDSAPERPSDPAPRPAGRPSFVTIARLEDRYKGHDVLIRALGQVRARVPDVEWIVIGDGPLRPGLEAQARSCGVAGAVRFLGSVSDERRDEWLRRADLLAMPSRLPGGGLAGEGFGIVYLEAGACSKPVLAGNVAGALDAVADGESGLLVDPTDPRAVAEGIVRLLLDPELARRLGRGGAARAREHAWPAIARRVEALLLEQLRSASHLGAPAAPGHERHARTAA